MRKRAVPGAGPHRTPASLPTALAAAPAVVRALELHGGLATQQPPQQVDRHPQVMPRPLRPHVCPQQIDDFGIAQDRMGAESAGPAVREHDRRGRGHRPWLAPHRSAAHKSRRAAPRPAASRSQQRVPVWPAGSTPVHGRCVAAIRSASARSVGSRPARSPNCNSAGSSAAGRASPAAPPADRESSITSPSTRSASAGRPIDRYVVPSQ